MVKLIGMSDFDGPPVGTSLEADIETTARIDEQRERRGNLGSQKPNGEAHDDHRNGRSLEQVLAEKPIKSQRRRTIGIPGRVIA